MKDFLFAIGIGLMIGSVPYTVLSSRDRGPYVGMQCLRITMIGAIAVVASRLFP